MFLGMKISNEEIARESFCSEGAVRKAIERGTLDVEKLGSVFDYVFKMRVKWLGWGAVEACGDCPVDHPENAELSCRKGEL